MDAAQALSELAELSSQVERAVVLKADGSVVAATPDDSAASQQLATAALDLLAAAFELRSSPQEVTRVEVELAEGAVFVLQEGGRTIAATTGSQPTSGLVVYDLRTCLERISEPEKPKRRSTKAEAKTEEDSASE
jgi:predicted regulator of Ras-like GTPase activity (Roadblock/LC7/MglB family)